MNKSFYFLLLIFLVLISCRSAKNKLNCTATEPNPDCICTMQYEPVCGCNDITYSNPCMAACHGITVYEKGECQKKKKWKE